MCAYRKASTDILVCLFLILLLLCFFHDASGLLANSHRKSFMTEVIVHYYIFLALWSVHPQYLQYTLPNFIFSFTFVSNKFVCLIISLYVQKIKYGDPPKEEFPRCIVSVSAVIFNCDTLHCIARYYILTPVKHLSKYVSLSFFIHILGSI